MIVGYSPERIARVAHEAAAALGELRAIASADPAADAAMIAVGRLRRAIADDVLAAVGEIARHDPLVAGLTRSSAVHDPACASPWYDTWSRSVLGPLGAESDGELLARLEAMELEVPLAASGPPDPHHPFWDELAEVSEELARRAAVDEAFASTLAARAGDTYLIGFAVRTHPFDPDLVARMARTVLETRSGLDDALSQAQAAAAVALLTDLAQHPSAALDLVSHPGADGDADLRAVRAVVDWRILDAAAVEALLGSAMSAAAEGRLDDGHRVIRNLVVLANEERFDAGFPVDRSPALAAIVASQVPYFMTSIRSLGDVHFRDDDLLSTRRRMGTDEEVVDLIGALMREPRSAENLLATVPALAEVATRSDDPGTILPGDVAAWAELLMVATVNEQREVVMHHEVGAERVQQVIAIASTAASIATTLASGPGATVVGIATGIAEDAARWLVDRSRPIDLGGATARAAAVAGLAIGLSAGVIAARRADEDDADVDRADDALARVRGAMDDGASVHEVLDLADDLVRSTTRIDDDGVLAVVDPVRHPEDHELRSD